MELCRNQLRMQEKTGSKMRAGKRTLPCVCMNEVLPHEMDLATIGWQLIIVS